ncbi:HvfX family Cu-binding RiPP maturation protein [Shewanella litorisediminis]|uniref:DoxX family protein n=1 Tax=Shewanella litorisediminis TaxID=1173586 RepID=A0ABX7G7C0_9GAMM|nr:DoxX family protein [Shewanella litorisediminis]MCL2916651.1 DoxX family protein [Shewanella litorisediminis]QRH03174.1 DoxX family protein [Shewanella litorisediminis]
MAQFINSLNLQARHLGEALAPLALRVYLAPVLMQAGYNKLSHFDDTAAWFGNPDWGLGLPFPELMTALAAGTEFFGAILLILGLFTRLISIPLMITMLVAAFTVHWQNGWLAIADPSSWLANEQVMASAERLAKARSLLQEHGNYDWLSGSGNFVVLNNGIEFAITYFVMLLALFAMGGGRVTSLDWWLAKRLGWHKA